MEQLVIRAPEHGDAAALAQIWMENCSYYAEMAPEWFQIPDEHGLVGWFESLLSEPPDDGELSLVAEVGGRVVGSLDASLLEPAEDANRQMVRELSQRRVVVNNLGVARDFWRSGVGSVLMEEVERWAREHGATQVGLDTYIFSPVSIPFYEKRLGYERQSINFRKRLIDRPD